MLQAVSHDSSIVDLPLTL